MRSSLFGENLEAQATDHPMVLQNPRLLKVALDGDLMARQGAMVAYQGQVDFAFEGGGIGRFLKKAVTGEGLPLMRCTGRGDVFLAQNADEIHLIDLDGSDGLTVNGANVLAFEPGLTWDVRRVEGASMFSGGVFNTVFSGTGRIAIAAHGTPVVLSVDAPTFADLQAAVAWSSSLQTALRRTATAGALIGRGSGEAFQLAFSGPGFVVIQASEGPKVVPHTH